MKNFSPKTTLAAAATLLLTVACTNELTDGPDGGKGRIAFHPLPETRTVVENADGMADGFNVWDGTSRTVKLPATTYSIKPP